VHSFDVFDTSLVRTLAIPDHLFFVLAETLLIRRGDDASKEKIADLARLRIQAARSARRASNRDDVPLEEIYRHIDLESWGIASAEMMEEELRLGSEAVRPVARTRAELERLQGAGEQIVFISDTPLPAAHLRKMLECAGMAHPDDRVYTSSDVGLTKSSGRLFGYVLEREGDLADRWVHHGDHPHSDVAVVRRLGIGTAPFFDTRLSRYERILLAEGEDEPLIRSRIAGVSRVARLMAATGTRPFLGRRRESRGGIIGAAQGGA
jgi:predicted HAD superfamily hydrolase